MSQQRTRIYVQRYNARGGPQGAHAHVVTSIVECDCGCVQEELFPAPMAVADDIRCTPEDFAAGRVGRDRLGYRSRDTDPVYRFSDE